MTPLRRSAPLSGVPGRIAAPSVRAQALERADECFRIEDAGVGRIQRGSGADVRFARADEGLIDDREAACAVSLAPRFQRLERRDLVRVLRDDQLSAAFMGYAVCRAEVVQHPRAVDAVPGLERARRVVHAGVNHLAVMRAGAHAGPALAFQHADAVAAPGDGPGGGKADHASADDGGISSGTYP